jgi:hypothetical protein
MRYMTLVTLCGRLSGMHADSHPHRVTSAKYHIDAVISPDDGRIVAQNMYRKEINMLRKIVHQVGFIYKIIQECRSTKKKLYVI